MSSKVWGALSASGLLLAAASSSHAASPPRVTGLYTTWDDYYFYAGFQVSDKDVSGTNSTPTSQPQQDDDIEVFFNTDKTPTHVRTARTFQMAVSAAQGAYFSVGDGSPIPKAKVVYTYKYAAGVDGTINDNSDTDTGYTVEVAIPWQELGQDGPPQDGTTWGFNVISRQRHDSAKPATSFFSLSSLVKSEGDVQDPSKWTKIVFDAGQKQQPRSSAELVVSPQVSGHFPLVNGSIVSGEWPSNIRIDFGTDEIVANAPTVAEEPNTGVSPFTTPPEDNTPPLTPTPPKPPQNDVVAKDPNDANAIPLPGGGAIKIVPGGIKTPSGFEPPDDGRGGKRNPLSAKLPPGYQPPAPGVSLSGTLSLSPPTPPSLLMAIYRIDYNGDGRKGQAQNVWDKSGRTLLFDQPIDGAGPWFSGLRTEWHIRQLTGMRRAGIDVALIRASSDDPLLGRELDALVAALKQLSARGADYPLIGVDTSDAAHATVDQILSHIPSQFLARLAGINPAGQDIAQAIAYDGAAASPAKSEKLADGSTVAHIKTGPDVALVSPGGLTGSGLTDRQDGRLLDETWQSAVTSDVRTIVLDSWNDFTNGTEVAPSRQYGEYYPDRVRLHTIVFNGNKQWHAKYLAENSPRTIRVKTLYQIPIRVQNAGTLPWRAGEMYALCPRWYKDGRLFDDSAPRVPLGRDLLPGQSATISVGVAAINSYGTDLEPGDYTLVFDIVQGSDRWFSYAGDEPLQVPVKVVAADAASKEVATFISSTTPTTAIQGEGANTTVQVRNDGSQPWDAASAALAYKILSIDPATGTATLIKDSDGVALGTAAVLPGTVAVVKTTVNLTAKDGSTLPAGNYRIHWYIKTLKGDTARMGAYDEDIEAVANSVSPSFVLSDINRSIGAGKDGTAKLAVQNMGSTAWRKSDLVVGYHWYYLDGTEAEWDGSGVKGLTKDVPPGRADGDIVAKFRAPKNPGRYMLVWDIRDKDGKWASTSGLADGKQLLPALVTVTGGGAVSTADTRSVSTIHGIARSGDTTANFDGKGGGLPDEMFAPDGTAEADLNPLLRPKEGDPLYPAGYYASYRGSGLVAEHVVPYLYPTRQKSNNDTVACAGQRISFSGGNYRAIRILAASTDPSGTTASFSLRSGGAFVGKHELTIANWLSTPEHIGAFSPYHRTNGASVPGACYLGDYTIPVEAGQRVDGIVLPDAPGIKILSVTAVK